MHRRPPARVGMIVATALLLGAAPPGTPPTGTEPPADRPAPIHSAGAALERGVVDATLAFLRSDARAVREALDRIAAGCRRLRRDDVSAWSEDVVVYDEAFHKTVDLAREFAAAEEMDKAFDQFTWAQKACRTCHEIAKNAHPAAKVPLPAAPKS